MRCLSSLPAFFRGRGPRFYVYMVLCSDNTLYTGVAKDLETRIALHNAGTGARYTRARRPVRLVWSCRAGSLSEAYREERRIKKLKRRDKLDMAGL